MITNLKEATDYCFMSAATSIGQNTSLPYFFVFRLQFRCLNTITQWRYVASITQTVFTELLPLRRLSLLPLSCVGTSGEQCQWLKHGTKYLYVNQILYIHSFEFITAECGYVRFASLPLCSAFRPNFLQIAKIQSDSNCKTLDFNYISTTGKLESFLLLITQ